MRAIARSIIRDILEAFGFSTIEDYESALRRCEYRRQELDGARGVVDALWVKLQVERDRAKRLREFVIEVKANTHPNASRHLGAPLYDLATKVLAETREPEEEAG